MFCKFVRDGEELCATLWELAAKCALRVHRNLHLSIHSHFPRSATPVVLREKAVAEKIKGRTYPELDHLQCKLQCIKRSVDEF